jgi:glycosyltransferase involved in cell wall biosynthesis
VTRPRRLLTIGHSYVVAQNRRLAHELALATGDRWEVTVAAPSFVHGDLRPISLEGLVGEACRLVPVRAYLTRYPHVMSYGATVRRLLGESWDVVHCWEEPYVLAGHQLSRWAGSARLVYYSFQNISKRYPPPFNWLERSSMRRAAGWIAAGHTVGDALGQRAGYTDKPRRVIPLGVDIGRFRPDSSARSAIRKSLGWSHEGAPVVGFLGRFVPEKGLGVLSTALDAIRSPWRALLVGGGQLEGDLRSWAARLPDDRVRIVTGVPHDEVPEYLNAMDILVAPSQTTARWKEQFGRMLIEAMACGVPVIGSNSGEIPYVIGDAGIVVGDADVAGWTRSIATLLGSPGRRAELSGAGRDRVASVFAWPVIASQHLDFLDTLVDSANPLGSPSWSNSPPVSEQSDS